jgi:hypothetical protein
MNAQLKRRAGTALVAGAAAAATLATTSVSTTASAAAAAPCAPRSVAARTFALPASAVKLLSGDRNFASNGPAVTAWAELEKWTVGSPGNFHDDYASASGCAPTRRSRTGPERPVRPPHCCGRLPAAATSTPRGCRARSTPTVTWHSGPPPRSRTAWRPATGASTPASSPATGSTPSTAATMSASTPGQRLHQVVPGLLHRLSSATTAPRTRRRTCRRVCATGTRMSSVSGGRTASRGSRRWCRSGLLLW